MKDFYSIIGVNKNASIDEIKSAYFLKRQLITTDNFNKTTQSLEQETTNENLADLDEALNVLSNEDSKQKYDSEYIASSENGNNTKLPINLITKIIGLIIGIPLAIFYFLLYLIFRLPIPIIVFIIAYYSLTYYNNHNVNNISNNINDSNSITNNPNSGDNESYLNYIKYYKSEEKLLEYEKYEVNIFNREKFKEDIIMLIEKTIYYAKKVNPSFLEKSQPPNFSKEFKTMIEGLQLMLIGIKDNNRELFIKGANMREKSVLKMHNLKR